MINLGEEPKKSTIKKYPKLNGDPPSEMAIATVEEISTYVTAST